MPRRVPRKPRPKKTNVPKGYDSTWEYNIHQTILQEWKHHLKPLVFLSVLVQEQQSSWLGS